MGGGGPGQLPWSTAVVHCHSPLSWSTAMVQFSFFLFFSDITNYCDTFHSICIFIVISFKTT